MKSKNLKVVNLDCPMCAGKLEVSLKNINGLENVNVDFLLQKISFDYTNDTSLESALTLINNFEEVKVLSASIRFSLNICSTSNLAFDFKDFILYLFL